MVFRLLNGGASPANCARNMAGPLIDLIARPPEKRREISVPATSVHIPIADVLYPPVSVLTTTDGFSGTTARALVSPPVHRFRCPHPLSPSPFRRGGTKGGFKNECAREPRHLQGREQIVTVDPFLAVQTRPARRTDDLVEPGRHNEDQRDGRNRAPRSRGGDALLHVSEGDEAH